MAAVSDDERGQLIVVGGLALAVTLVAVALVLNAAIYTENLASRDDADRIDDANAVRNDVRAGLVGAVETAQDSNPDSFVDQTDDADASIAEIEAEGGYYAAQDGASLSVGGVSYEEGRRLARDTEGGFESPNLGEETYTLAESVRVRNHTMNVSKSSLRQEDDITGLIDSAVFNVTYDDGTDRRSVFVYENSSGDVSVEVQDASGTRIGSICSTPANDGYATLDITAGTLGGERCAALDFFGDLGSVYDLVYTDTHRASGTYSVIVDVSGGAAVVNDQHAPDYSHAVYAAEATITYRSPELYYETTIRYAPGDPHA